MSREILVYAIGEEAAQLLAETLGGADYRVPSAPGCDSYGRLVDIIGQRLADRLVAIAGGDVLYIPRNHLLDLASRNEAVASMLRRGMSPGDIARTFTYTARLSERHVYRIMDRLRIKRGTEQLDLFRADARQDSEGEGRGE